MASSYSNNGPIYTTLAKFNALVAAGNVELGREYRIVDLTALCIFTGAGAPTTSTAAQNVGDRYFDTTNSVFYNCTAISGTTYTWTIVPKDVQLNGTTIVNATTGVATIPLTNVNQLGAVALANQYGLEMHGSAAGYIGLTDASEDAIANRSGKNNSGYGAITPTNVDKAVMEGLGNTSTTWSDEYKSSARNTIGAGKAMTIKFEDDV